MHNTIRIIYKGKHTEPIEIVNAEKEIRYFLENDEGKVYYDYKPVTPSDYLYPEDLSITLVLNSMANKNTILSAIKNYKSLKLNALTNKKLVDTNDKDREEIANFIYSITKWPYFSASMVTKVLHKKKPHLIPIMDNQSIFGAYMNPHWPKDKARSDSVNDRETILETINCIYSDITSEVNLEAFQKLNNLFPQYTIIEIFDMIWWVYFKYRAGK